MIKLIAIDLDGTLLSADKTISQRNQTVLAQARQAGIKVVICTGRPLAAIGEYLSQLDLLTEADYSITFNGGLIQKNNGEILQQQMVTGKEVQTVYQAVDVFDLPLTIIKEGTATQIKPSNPKHASIYASLNPKLNYQTQTIASIQPNATYNKMTIAIEDVTYLQEKMQQLPTTIMTNFTIVKSRDCLYELLNKATSKGNALRTLGTRLGIDVKEMMAIGDEENDLSMLTTVGFGVAMGNAGERVKQAARIVTGSNEADGVAQVIEKVLQEKW